MICRTDKTLTLWLWLTDKSAQTTCLLGMDGQQIGQLESTIVPQMVNKSTELIVHARHEWPINWPPNYQPWKYENLCFSILVLVIRAEIEFPGSLP